jgi:flavorubredoxin
MYDSTRHAAEAIAEGIRQADPVTTVKLFNSAKTDKSDLITEIFRSKAVCIGSPTVNGGLLSSVASLLEELKGIGLTGKKATAFGSYGWSPASTKIINEKLKESGFEIVGDGIKINWQPDESALESCVAFGSEFAKAAVL